MKIVGIIVLTLTLGGLWDAQSQETGFLEKVIYGQVTIRELSEHVRSHQTGTPLMSLMTYQTAMDSLSRDASIYISQMAQSADTVTGAYAGRWTTGSSSAFEFLALALSQTNFGEPEVEIEGEISRGKFARITVKFNPNQRQQVVIAEPVGRRTDIFAEEISIKASHQNPRAVQRILEIYLKEKGVMSGDVRIKTSNFSQTAIKNRIIQSLAQINTPAFRRLFADKTRDGMTALSAVRISNEVSERTDLSPSGEFGRALKTYLDTRTAGAGVNVTFKTLRGDTHFAIEAGKGSAYQQILQQVRHALTEFPTVDYLRVSAEGMNLNRAILATSTKTLTSNSIHEKAPFSLDNSIRLRGLVPRIGGLAGFEVWIPQRLDLGRDRLPGVKGEVVLDGRTLELSGEMNRFTTNKDGTFTYIIEVQDPRNLVLFVNLKYDQNNNVVAGGRGEKLLVATGKYGEFMGLYETEFQKVTEDYPKPGAKSCSFLAANGGKL